MLIGREELGALLAHQFLLVSLLSPVVAMSFLVSSQMPIFLEVFAAPADERTGS